MATYNCSDSPASAYGNGGYGTCLEVGAPDTGVFQQFMSSGSFTIVAPLMAAIVVTLITTVIVRRRKSHAN